MGVAIQTVAGVAVNPGATFTAVTVNTGDSFNPANFALTDQGFLHQLIRGAATAGAARLISPRLADAVRPIELHTDIVQSRLLLPRRTGQPVYPADVITAQLTGGTAETDVLAATYYYSNLPGIAARLHMWADLAGLVRNIKTIQVAVTNSATIGAWTDTVLTTTENLIKADSDYAVLGYTTDTALTAIGIKGPDTGNFRICDTGSDFSDDTAEVFINNSERHGLPWIPVFAANNRAATFVSTIVNTASTTANISLICAELSQRVTP